MNTRRLCVRFDDHSRRIIQLAKKEMRELHNEYLGTVHVFIAFLNFPPCYAYQVLSFCLPRHQALRDKIREEEKLPEYAIFAGHPIAPRLIKTCNRARALAGPRSKVTTKHLLRALIEEKESKALQVLKDNGADVREIKGQLE